MTNRYLGVARALRATITVATILSALPVAAGTITVNGSGDIVAVDGVCTLREAIINANANAATNPDCAAGTGADTIAFNIPGATLPRVINITSALPTITDRLTIDGSTQPGATANVLDPGDNAVIGVELNGSGAGAAAGLVVNVSFVPTNPITTQVVINGLSIRSFGGPAIRLLSTDNFVEGCFIGVNGGNGGTTGEPAIVIDDPGTGVGAGGANFIGTGGAGTRNIISGNPNGGIGMTAHGSASFSVEIRGNYRDFHSELRGRRCERLGG